MKIEDHIFKQMCDRKDNYPVHPEMIRLYLPCIEDFRKVVPPIMSSEDLDWIYLRHCNHGRDSSPEWRSRLMYYINHFVKLRTDPDFISSEAAVCHLTNNQHYQKNRWKVIREMEEAAGADGDEIDFVEWYTNKGNRDYRSKKYIPVSHDGRPVISRDHNGWYPTHHINGRRLPCKRLALLYAKAKARERFMDMLGRVL